MKNQMKRDIAWGPEVSQVQEVLSQWSGGVPSAQHLDVSTNPEASQTT